jgi:hypothetical protein
MPQNSIRGTFKSAPNFSQNLRTLIRLIILFVINLVFPALKACQQWAFAGTRAPLKSHGGLSYVHGTVFSLMGRPSFSVLRRVHGFRFNGPGPVLGFLQAWGYSSTQQIIAPPQSPQQVQLRTPSKYSFVRAASTTKIPGSNYTTKSTAVVVRQV